MNLSYRCRLYPNREQRLRLQGSLDSCRWLYNYFLEQMREPRSIARAYGWTSYSAVPSRFDLQAQLPRLKQAYPFLADVYSKALQMVLHQLYSNLRALAELRKKGEKAGGLRFKGKHWYKTITYNQSGFKVNGKKLWLSKIGEINIKLHRPVDGVVKQVKVKREASGRWFAILCVEDAPLGKTCSGSDKQVGIDLGLSHYVVDSDGLFVGHPRNIARAERRLAREQRWLGRKEKGSSNRRKQRARVAGVHERVVDRRRDFLHKLSRYYVDNYGFIAVEDLDCKEMMMSACNARNHADSAWSTFIGMLEYKAERAGIQLVKVDSRNTTQSCSNCGALVRKGLWMRIHRCPVCGFEADRDYNASLNILRRGLSSVGRGPPESTPVETGPPPEPTMVPASLVVEAGSSFLTTVRER